MEAGRHRMHFVSARRWSKLNEYEGEVVGRFGDQLLTAHVTLHPAQWDESGFQRGGEVELLLQRGSGEGHVEVLHEPCESRLEQVDGIWYSAVGPVTEVIDEERVVIDAGIPLLIDLDWTQNNRIPVGAGMCIRVQGALELDLSPDADS